MIEEYFDQEDMTPAVFQRLVMAYGVTVYKKVLHEGPIALYDEELLVAQMLKESGLLYSEFFTDDCVRWSTYAPLPLLKIAKRKAIPPAPLVKPKEEILPFTGGIVEDIEVQPCKS